MATEALLHRHLDLVDGVLAPAADRDHFDRGARLVGCRDQDATTRELDLEGDAPGRFEGVHRLLAPIAPHRAPDAGSGRSFTRRSNTVGRVDERGVVEWK
jgi:hypothetical protein